MPFSYSPGGHVEVPDIPFEDRLALPSQHTAVIVVDMQNDFVKEGGALVIPAAEDTIPRIADLLDRARSNGARVVYTQDTHYEGDREWEIWPEHCRKGTRGWQIVEELAPRDEEFVFQKNRYDGFYGTALDHYLGHVWDIEHLVIVGTVANICVGHTAGSAGLRWYDPIIPADGVSAQTEFDQALALRQTTMLYAGKVVHHCEDIAFE